MDNPLNILYEDAGLLVVNKPADLACHPTKGDANSSLVGRLRMYLGAGATPHLINRLDRETSGVVLVGKDLETARELRRRWEQRRVSKEYWAVVHGWPAQPQGRIAAPIQNDAHSQVAIKGCVGIAGTPAETEYEVLKTWIRAEGRFAWLRVAPATGRKHQIRIHLAHAGHPIVGDKIYGGDETLYLAFVQNRLADIQRQRLILPHHALHARSVRLIYRQQEQTFVAEPEPWFMEFAGLAVGAHLGVALNPSACY